MKIRIIAALAASSVLCACATAPRVEGDFGNSFDSLIKAQVANPAALNSPSSAPVTGVDPDYANNVVTEMRQHVGKRETVEQPIQIMVGGAVGR